MGADAGRGLVARGWIRREPDAVDRRRKLLWVTPDGEQAVQQMKRLVARVQTHILAPLSPQEREQLLALLGKLVSGHEAAGVRSD